jgi:succinate dehydrogenase / fumarate reductase cytochrome b subunit
MKLIEALAYRLPVAGLVSILHRASGLLMFVLLPFVIWMFDKSVTSEVSYGEFMSVFRAAGYGWFVKLIALGLIWAYLHHLIAGLRHLLMDVSHSAVNKEFGRQSAVFTLAASLLLTVALGIKLFFF